MFLYGGNGIFDVMEYPDFYNTEMYFLDSEADMIDDKDGWGVSDAGKGYSLFSRNGEAYITDKDANLKKITIETGYVCTQNSNGHLLLENKETGQFGIYDIEKDTFSFYSGKFLEYIDTYLLRIELGDNAVAFGLQGNDMEDYFAIVDLQMNELCDPVKLPDMEHGFEFDDDILWVHGHDYYLGYSLDGKLKYEFPCNAETYNFNDGIVRVPSEDIYLKPDGTQLFENIDYSTGKLIDFQNIIKAKNSRKQREKKSIVFSTDDVEIQEESPKMDIDVVSYTGFDGTVINTEYVFSDSNSRRLEYSELINLSQFELLIARNEIYARHGRMFNMEALSQYFATRDWYHPQIPADQFGDNDLSSLELENAKLILEVEHEKGIYY